MVNRKFTILVSSYVVFRFKFLGISISYSQRIMFVWINGLLCFLDISFDWLLLFFRQYVLMFSYWCLWFYCVVGYIVFFIDDFFVWVGLTMMALRTIMTFTQSYRIGSKESDPHYGTGTLSNTCVVLTSALQHCCFLLIWWLQTIDNSATQETLSIWSRRNGRGMLLCNSAYEGHSNRRTLKRLG